jgi:hypothetical protein
VYSLLGNGNTLFFGGYQYATGTELYEGDASILLTAQGADKIIKLPSKSTDFTASLSPNPVTSVARLHLTGDIKTANISVADMNGKIVWAVRGQNAEQIIIPVEKLPAGVYMITIASGTATKKLKMVKQ